MSVHKNKSNNTWYVKYKNNTYRGFASKKEAELHEAMLITGEAKAIGKGITFEKGFEDYIEKLRLNASFGTVQKRLGIYNSIIKPHFPYRAKIENITRLDCRKFYEWLHSTDYATSYKNIILNLLEAVFKHCDVYFDTGCNPVSVLDKFKPTFEEQASKREKQFNVWTTEEFNQFISCVEVDTYRLLFIVLYYTGMRKGEALALKWRDYSSGLFDINKSVTTKTANVGYEIKEPKNVYSNRKVSIGSQLSELVEAYKQKEMKVAGYNADWFIFGREKPLSTTTIDRVKAYAIAKSGVKPIRIHDLRHSHASNLFAQRIDYITISKRLGHNSPETTLNVYAHLIGNTNDIVNNYLNQSSQNLLKIFSNRV